MTTHLHILKGCAPTPLANYLKALGILRLVGEQADHQARGWWEGERFCLLTTLSKEKLERFFLEDYAPTPLVAPWNGGSGFYRTWDEKKKRLRNSKKLEALNELIDKGGNRIERLREAVEEIRRTLPKYCIYKNLLNLDKKQINGLLIMPSGDGPVFPVISKSDSGKTKLQQELIRFSRCTPFYRSALVEIGEEVKYFWMWGSGGNDGAIDYTGRFFENLKLALIPTDKKLNTKLLRNSLFFSISTGFLSKEKGKVGQFNPFGAGGANITTGIGSQDDTYINYWDYILALEGAILFSLCATRMFDSNVMSQASAPFAIRSHAAGFATPGFEKAQRGEQWMPLWRQPATLADLSAMLGEARIQLGRQPAHRPIDAARAISRLGVARGVEAFVRYGYLERNGQSNLAVPLGRIEVRYQPRSSLIEDLAGWMDRLQSRSRDGKATARLIHAERRLADAVFAALTHDHTSDRWQAILLAAVEVETLQATGTALEMGPIPRLRPEWVAAVDDGSAEVRLALALGSAAAEYDKRKPVDSVRYHLLPLEPKNAGRFQLADKRLVNDPRVVATGRDPLRDLAAIVERRLIESAQKGQRRSRLVAASGCEARLNDLAQFLRGELDLNRLFGLARAFMAIRWDRWSKAFQPKVNQKNHHPEECYLEECWLALRLCCLPWEITENLDIPADERIVRLLLAGDASRAIEIARQRLRSKGIRPPIYAGMTDPQTARRWAAALVFPIHRRTAQEIVGYLSPTMKGAARA